MEAGYGVVGEERIRATGPGQVAAQVADGLGEVEGQELVASRQSLVDRGEVEQILEAARHLPVLDTQMEEVEKALGYFEVNRERMRYAHFRELGIFVASGAVEAGCKAVVAQRLKLSGMRWSVRGAAAIITLRC